MAVFRDDLARVGERLVKCGREAEFLRYTDFQAHVVKPRVDASKDLLETANETRDAQRVTGSRSTTTRSGGFTGQNASSGSQNTSPEMTRAEPSASRAARARR